MPLRRLLSRSTAICPKQKNSSNHRDRRTAETAAKSGCRGTHPGYAAGSQEAARKEARSEEARSEETGSCSSSGSGARGTCAGSGTLAYKPAAHAVVTLLSVHFDRAALDTRARLLDAMANIGQNSYMKRVLEL